MEDFILEPNVNLEVYLYKYVASPENSLEAILVLGSV